MIVAKSVRRKLKLMEWVRVRSAEERMQQILDERTAEVHSKSYDTGHIDRIAADQQGKPRAGEEKDRKP